MSAALLRHPASLAAAVSTIRVDLARTNASLVITYTLSGEVDQLAVPTPLAAPPTQATDGLWEHTCFEAFLADPRSARYREFNFSPSGEWAIYDFVSYRTRTEIVLPALFPKIAVQREANGLTAQVEIPSELVPPDAELAGITAVVETRDGAKQYWALAHPGERPDFHLRDAFLLTLPH